MSEALPFSPLISPTKARRDAAQARDWAYVTAWLSQKYNPNPVPRFERNSETLDALLQLAAANEAADVEVDLVQRAEVEELKHHEETRDSDAVRLWREVLGRLDLSLDEQSRGVANQIVEASLLLGALDPEPQAIGERICELRMQKWESDQHVVRLQQLQARLEREMEEMKADIEQIRALNDGEVYGSTEESIQQQTAQLNRETKQFTGKIAEYTDRAAGLEKFKIACPTIVEIKKQEGDVKLEQARVKIVEKELAAFHGLPPDLTAARGEYQRATTELQTLKRQRDRFYEGMVNQ